MASAGDNYAAVFGQQRGFAGYDYDGSVYRSDRSDGGVEGV